jgi:hypothetical protein
MSLIASIVSSSAINIMVKTNGPGLLISPTQIELASKRRRRSTLTDYTVVAGRAIPQTISRKVVLLKY